MAARIVRRELRVLLCGIVSFAALGLQLPTRAAEERHGDGDVVKHDDDRKWSARRIQRDGCVLRVLVPESSSKADVPLEVVIQNRGAKRFTCGETGYFMDCIVKLTTRDGVAIPYTKHGRHVLSGPGEHRDGGQYGIGVYSSGQSRSWVFNLTEGFGPLVEGEYRLTLMATVMFESKHVKPDAPESEKFTDRVELVAKDIAFLVTSR